MRKLKKHISTMLVVMMLVSILPGCGGKKTEGISEDNGHWATVLSTTKTESVSNKMNADTFDERFMQYLSEKESGNYMVSPLSFRYALGLLLAGADGETKKELLTALGVQSEEEWNAKCREFNGFVEFFNDDLKREQENIKNYIAEGWFPKDTELPSRALRVANSIWKAERINKSFKDAYKDIIEKNYAAEYRSFNEKNAVEKINEWADIKTEHMIPELLPKNYPTESLAIVLMNALYFKDSWAYEFSKELTQKGDFHARSGKTTKKDFMTMTDSLLYYEDKDTKLVILPMNGGVYMTFVLGSADGLADKVSAASSRRVHVTIPRIDLETDLSNKELVDFLKKFGAIQVFDQEKADLSAMIDHKVFVSDIIQKTKIKLDETGVEAAAVTAIMCEETAYIIPTDPVEFKADQPFSFYIYTTCNDTTAILFAGEIVE